MKKTEKVKKPTRHRRIGLDEIVKQIFSEIVEFGGMVNFASHGISGNPEMLMRAFRYGFEIGVECTKKDAIRIIQDA